ncbi:hypothetical protein V8D89_008476 [Ganoderma adspersum]
MASAYDIWGVIASVIGLLSIFQILVAVINAQLPTSRLRKFDHLREETDQLLRSVAEEGLFQDGGQYIENNEARIAKVCNRLEALRAQAFTAKTYTDEVRQWWNGLSSRISVCCEDLKSLRVHISTTSSKAREALSQHQQEQAAASATGPVPDVETDVIADAVTVASLKCPMDDPIDQRSSSDDGDKASSAAILDSVPQPEYISKEGSDSPVPISPIADQNAVEGFNDASPYPTHPRSDFPQVPPPYRRNTVPPPYQSSTFTSSGANIVRTAAVLARYTANHSHSARVNHKLVQAYRRNLMLHNVPWKDERTPGRGGLRSAASSCHDLSRPSVTPKAWNALRKTRGVLSMYVTVLSSDEPLLPTSSVIDNAATT